jgi:hypothetical protein
MKANREQQNTECLEKDVFLAAVHEAGHALADTKLGVGIEYATIERKKVRSYLINGGAGHSVTGGAD